MSDKAGRTRDGKYWCSEGCGFVGENHRCEQWSNLTFIPPDALQRIRDEAVKESAEELSAVTAERDRFRAELWEFTRRAALSASHSEPATDGEGK
jgi:hypothetical protein